MSTPPPGWFPVEGAPGFMRWWDGQQWTDHVIQPVMAPGLPGQNPSRAFPGAGKLGIVGGIAAVIGSFLPWVSVLSIFGTIDISGFDAGDGKITAGAAVAALLLGCLGLANASRAAVIVGIVAAFVGLAVSVYDWVDVNDHVSNADLEVARASVGFGLYICVAGFILCAVGFIVSLSDDSQSSANGS